MNTEALMTALMERQAREGWSDREMGRQLSVNHTTWRGIKIGRQRPGVSFIQRAVARFPEYQTLLLMPTDVSMRHIQGSDTNRRAA